MERYTVAGLMAANKKQSQTPHTDELLARLPSAKSGGTSQEDRLAALSDNQRSLLGDLIERIAKFVSTIFESLGFDPESHLPGPAGRPFPLVDFGSEPIRELFA